MTDQKIYAIGFEEFILMMGLLGIEGHIIENPNEFQELFNKLIKDENIGMIIISLNLSEDDIQYLIEFKLNNIKPFVFYLPDILGRASDDQNVILSKILKSIGKIIS